MKHYIIQKPRKEIRKAATIIEGKQSTYPQGGQIAAARTKQRKGREDTQQRDGGEGKGNKWRDKAKIKEYKREGKKEESVLQAVMVTS